MFDSIRNRLIVIAVLVLGSIYSLIPRNETHRERDANGVMQDVTTRRVPLKLGLDLQGGMHLGLELDESQRVSTDRTRDIDLALTVLRKRIDEFGVAEPVIQRVGDRIIVELAGVAEEGRAKSIVTRNAFLEFRMADKTGALDRVLPAIDRALAQAGVRAATGAAQPLDRSVASLLGGDTTKKADSATKAGDTVAVADSSAPPATGPIFSGLLRPGGEIGVTTPGAYAVAEASYPRADELLRHPELQRLLPRGIELKWQNAPVALGTEQYRVLYALEKDPIVTGASLVDATAQIDPGTNRNIVAFELDRAGGRKFGQETSRHVGDYMAIVLDGTVQGAPPVINSRIDRNGQIELSGRSLQEAQDLALTLKAGSLPVPLKVVEETQVGASLGEDSIRSGITAGVVGTILVVLIMISYYAFSGVLAVVGLGLYLLFTLGALAGLGATLTLPGLAGLVLSIGIAVDANVLIFERIREELALGKSVRAASDEGFHRAMNAIVDSNVCAIVTALFLYEFGTGPVRGFAVTLIVGTLASMITAIFVTRTFFLVWLSKRSPAAPLSI